MRSNLFEKIIGIGLFLIVLIFNPFVFAGLYIDSTNSYSFVATNKIYLLALMNAILLFFWILKIRATKELNITPSKVYWPVFLWLGSAVVSYFLSVNRINSLFGYNFTLENTLIESGMLVIFFIIFVNNIRTKEELENILRYFLSAVTIAAIYLIIRYSGTWTTSSELFRDYFNTNTFSFTGHITTVPLLACVAFIFGLGLVISDFLYERSIYKLIIDSINAVVAGTLSFMLLNLSSLAPDYLSLIALVILLICLLYVIFTNKKLQHVMIPVLALLLLSVAFGLGLYYGVTKNTAQPQILPSVSLDTTWNVTLDSIKNPIERGLWGNGQATYTYFFDRYKSESLAIAQVTSGNQIVSSFTINAQAPTVEEIRIYQPGSYLLGVLFAQGILGLVFFIGILVMTVLSATKKGVLSVNLMSYISLLLFITVMIFTIFYRYDFMLLFLVWFTLGVHTISINEDEPQKNLVISLSGRSIDFSNNLNYLVPSLLLGLTVITLFSTFKVIPGNYYLYQAKEAQLKGDLVSYQDRSSDALQWLNQSDLVAREVAYSRGIEILNTFQKIQKKVVDNPSYKDTDDYKKEINNAAALQQQFLNTLDSATSLYPYEYKNYFLAGFMISRTSETISLSLDATAEKYLIYSRNNNLYHPETLYELAKIYVRNKDFTNAYSHITPAVAYKPDNIYYQALNADILKNVGNYQKALTIYQELKNVKDANPNNQALQEFYVNQDIDKDIAESQKKLKEQQENQATPTPTVTPTPVKK